MATAPRRSEKPRNGIPSKAAKPAYEPVLELLPLPADQYEALRSNIALNGVLVPILVDSCGPTRRIIDGNHRKRIADELGYECREVVKEGRSDQEVRTLARMLNLARRQLSQKQKRQIIADQLRETPRRSNNWIGKQLGVHHSTVAAVRASLEATRQIDKFERTEGADGKYHPTTYANGHAHPKGNDRPGDALDSLHGRSEAGDLRLAQAPKSFKSVLRTDVERRARIDSTRLIHGDCREALKSLPSASVDAVITDPIYPEVDREYGRISEAAWHDLMRTVVA